MKNLFKISFILFIIPFSLCLMSCNSDAKVKKENNSSKTDKSENKKNNPFSDLKKAAEEMEKVMDGDAEVADPVNFRELKELLPKNFSGFNRTEASGSTQGVMGMTVSNAEGKYEDDDGGKMTITIVDAGGMGMIIKGMASWTNFEVDKESDNEYERTTEIDGHKAYQKYNSKNRRGETAILVDGRFIVTVTGRKVDEKSIKKAIDKLDLRDLKKLAK